MSKSWNIVKLAELISYKKNFFDIQDDISYKLCRVQTKFQGVVLRSTIQGYDIKTKQQQSCSKGDLIFAEMDARFGGYGIIPEHLDGAIVSSHYFLYEINSNKVNPKFLEFALTLPEFFKQIQAKGSTNYASIRPNDVLEYLIKLPPLEEQRRIVKILDKVQQKSEQIKQLRAEQAKEIENLRNSFFIDLQQKYQSTELSAFLIPAREVIILDPETVYKQVTVKMEHKGVLLRTEILGSEVASTQFLATTGNFIISKIDARNGAMGMIPEELNESIVTNDFPLFDLSEDILPEYFDIFTHTEYFDIACKNASEGSTNRKRLKMNKFLSIKFPLPSIEEQQRIVRIFQSLYSMKSKQNETITKLEELFPALLDKAFKGEL